MILFDRLLALAHFRLFSSPEVIMFLIFVFNPALQGDEVHGEDGSYSA